MSGYALSAALLLLSLRSDAAPDPAAKRKPAVFFMISEQEYDTKTTLPAFAKAELEPRGIECLFSIASPDAPDDFPGLDALHRADLLFISVRRRALTIEQMQVVRAFVASGKPIIGIRTASHAFAPRPSGSPPPPGRAYWPEFDAQILGGNYHDHYGVGMPTIVRPVAAQAAGPLLAGIPAGEFTVPSHLYKNPRLPDSDTLLLIGRLTTGESEPVAWTRENGGQRIFYTSLGAPGDFEAAPFRRILVNALWWALRLDPR